jgi:putative membrane protein
VPAGVGPVFFSLAMLWIKSLHVVFVVAWFSGLFYLPRLFMNLALETNEDATARLLLMARKLYRFTSLIALVAIAFGLWLFLGYGIGLRGSGNGWMHAKLALVLVVIGYHHACGMMLKKFQLGLNRRSATFFRVFNESAVLLLAAIVVLVIVKPF